MDYDFEINGIYYKKISDVEVAVTYGDSKYIGDISIPPSITINEKSYAVTAIGNCAFHGCSGMDSVTIPNSVTSFIGGWAFRGCSGLNSVHITDLAAWCKINFHSIDANPLFYAHSLYLNGKKVTDLVIPKSTTAIKYYAFSGCSGLTSVTIPDSVTEIGSGAFSGCSGLTSVNIPNSVTKIGRGAFGGCSGLTSVTIPNSVTKIGGGAFCNCSGLNSVTIGNSVTSIGTYCFPKNTKLIFEDGSSAIINGVFYNRDKTILLSLIDKSLKNLTTPNSVTEIGDRAFSDCIGLTSVTIGNSVTKIGDWAFSDCRGLTSVTIPNSVSEIGRGAFSGCSGLTSVTIGDSVTEIGDYAFSGCSSLTSVNIPNSVTGIGDWAFSGCSGLTSVNIPNSVTEIGYHAFLGCSGLTSVNIPSSNRWANLWKMLQKRCVKPTAILRMFFASLRRASDVARKRGVTAISLRDGISVAVAKPWRRCRFSVFRYCP